MDVKEKFSEWQILRKNSDQDIRLFFLERIFLWRSNVFRWTVAVKDPLFQNSIRSLAFGLSWRPGGILSQLKTRTNRKEIRSLFREAILIPKIECGVIKIKVFVIVRRPNKSVTCLALSRSIMNPFLSYFCSPPVKYVISSDTKYISKQDILGMY